MQAEPEYNTKLDDSCVLRVTDLGVQFGADEHSVDVVRDLSFHVDKGETLAIVGESGSGKSVASLALMRLLRHGGGRILNGEMLLRRRNGDVLDLVQAGDAQLRSIRGADMAMIFQEPMTSLNPIFSVGDQIAESLNLHRGMNKREALAETLRLLDQVRIPDARGVIRRYPHQLSGGMRQRVMIAMALACQPVLLIADEPTTALDVTIQAQIIELIRDLQNDMHMGVMFITHDMGVVAEVADRVLVMCRGDRIEDGPTRQVLERPEQVYTKALLAAVPRLGSMRGTDMPQHFALVDSVSTIADTRSDRVAVGGSAMMAEPSAPGAAPRRLDTQQPILKVRDLVMRFNIPSSVLGRVKKRVHAVEKVSFDLHPGETLGLVGESGSGKSTTGRALLRLIESQSGEIEFQGRSITQLHGAELQALRRDIQFIFQDPFASLDPRVTVGYSIIEPLLVHKLMSTKAAEARMFELLDKVGLPRNAAQRYPHEFSGGQRQRVCIARALSLDPKVVIADESVSALDVSIQAQIVNLMIDLQRDMGIAFLFISHDMAVIERVSHRVAVMYLGQIVEMGPRRAVFENPQHPYTRKLMDAVPVADPSRRHARRELLSGEIPSPIRRVGDEPDIHPLQEVSVGHYVASHQFDAV